MRPQRCITAMPHGDCWRACIATIIGAPIESVPNFMHLPEAQGSFDRGGRPIADAGLRLTREWLAPHGFSLFETYCSAKWSLTEVLATFSQPNPDVPVIVIGVAGDGSNDSHAIVAMNGDVAHDPSGVGLNGPFPCADPGCECGMAWWWLYTISVAERWSHLRGL